MIKQFLRVPAVLLLAFALTACATRGGNVPYEPATLVAPDQQSVVPAATEQRIGALDTLQITVFQVDSLSGEFRVDQAGLITFPLLGTIEAKGKTAPELSDIIGKRLSERYLQAPMVRVSIKESAEQSVTVDGSVKNPGIYPIKAPTSLMRAVAMAQGFSEDANPARVIVFRTVNGERVAGAFDLRAIRRAEAADPVIYGNDVVIVDGNRARSIFRDLLGSIPMLGILRPY